MTRRRRNDHDRHYPISAHTVHSFSYVYHSCNASVLRNTNHPGGITFNFAYCSSQSNDEEVSVLLTRTGSNHAHVLRVALGFTPSLKGALQQRRAFNSNIKVCIAHREALFKTIIYFLTSPLL